MATSSETITISSDFIKLDSFLKFAAAVESGGEAKLRILDGEVSVNGEPCFQRGKKLRDGDRVGFNGNEYLVRGETE